MDHGPAVVLGVDKAQEKKQKLGVKLFIVYSLIYALFVAIGVADYTMMGNIIFGGLNLAVVYGFGLILLAIVMGLIYNSICTKYEDELNKED